MRMVRMGWWAGVVILVVLSDLNGSNPVVFKVYGNEVVTSGGGKVFEVG